MKSGYKYTVSYKHKEGMERSDDIYLPQSVVCSHAVGGKEDAEGSSPQSFCYKGLVLWKTIFHRLQGGCRWGKWFQFCLPLNSCSVAQFLTDNETLPVHGSGLWTPELGDRKTEIQKSSFCNMQPFPGERKKDNLALAGTVSISYYTIKKDTESQKNF